jgi:predicted GIY-YIG superfamily endonuclease
MVYLIHLDSKLKHSQHYIGFVDGGTDRLNSRLDYHRRGRGSKFLKAVVDAGIDFVVSRTWVEGDRNFERKLKNMKNARRLCPICRGDDK